MADNTAIGDRMKFYERQAAGQRLMPLVPVLARLDGRAFHTFCKGLVKPYDENFHKLMVETSKFLVEETNALVAYTQSDEITLLWYSEDFKQQVFFDGRVQKMVSVLAGLATAQFNRLLPEYLSQKASMLPVFDCRVWTVPNKAEAANVFLWREQDATRNSVQLAGQAVYEHEELHERNQSDIQEMLHTKGINWNDYPDWAKRGSWIRREKVTRPFTTEDIESLPEKHQARTNPDLQVERWETVVMYMPPFSKVINKEWVLFKRAVPLVDQWKLAVESGAMSITAEEDARIVAELLRCGEEGFKPLGKKAPLVGPTGRINNRRALEELFPIEPLPDGAEPIYFREPDTPDDNEEEDEK